MTMSDLGRWDVIEGSNFQADLLNNILDMTAVFTSRGVRRSVETLTYFVAFVHQLHFRCCRNYAIVNFRS